MTHDAKLPIHVISGATGRTCDEVLRAALAQFDDPKVEVVLRTGVRTVEVVEELVEEAAAAGAVVCHSVVEPATREALLKKLRIRNVPSVDVLGPLITLLEDYLGQSPRRQAGLSYQLQKESFDRIDAVDFTLEHDDGCGLGDLDLADVVIVGVSRVSKSVTCFYLSYQGVRAANVPLVPDLPPLPQLLKVDPKKVIGLTMNANRLRSVREVRIGTMGEGPFGEYGDRRAITAELSGANEIMKAHGWRSIDVSYKSVEEVAKEVLALIGR
jgi:regulator of PEP synthase PpsR (kinase-PPPase family)